MKGFIAILIAGTLGMSSGALAQSAGGQPTPPAESQTPAASAPAMLGNTGLTQEQAIGIGIGTVLLGVALSDDNSSSTTTAGH
ncbi:hypothetical protein [Pseudodonghicola xiamenensis]|nr:hypothetical protein [Pseudodonghicola xiamenensis]